MHHPTKEDCTAILEFFKTIPDDARIYIHCFAGVSRSSAMCYMLHSHDCGPGNEDQAMVLTNLSAPYKGIWPNDLITEYADELLERNGAHFQALQRWKQETIKNEKDIAEWVALCLEKQALLIDKAKKLE